LRKRRGELNEKKGRLGKEEEGEDPGVG